MKEKREQLSLRIESVLIDFIKDYASKKGLSTTAQMNLILDDFAIDYLAYGQCLVE